MESEKVKEIKKALEVYGKENKGITILRGGEIQAITYTDILTLINELESENERLLGVAKEKIHDIGEMGYTHAIETKKLKDNNTEIKNARDRLLEENKTLVWLNQNMCKETQQLKDRIAELEKQMCRNEDLHNATEKLNDTIILKQFAERLKEKLYNHRIWELPYEEWCKGNVVCGKIDETLKEFINKGDN